MVELDDHLSKPINLLSVGKYSSAGRDSIWVVQEEVLCQGPLSQDLCWCWTPLSCAFNGQSSPFSLTFIPHLACCRQCEDEGAEAESWALVWLLAYWGWVPLLGRPFLGYSEKHSW